MKIYSPIVGTAISIEEVPDQTFASKLLGDGIGIQPKESGVIMSPVDGVVKQIFETNHAFTVETDENVEILIHFGLNTVELRGKGFERLVQEGDRVKQGTPIIKYDLDFLKENSDSVVTPVVILDHEQYSDIKIMEDKEVDSNSLIIEVEI